VRKSKNRVGGKHRKGRGAAHLQLGKHGLRRMRSSGRARHTSGYACALTGRHAITGSAHLAHWDRKCGAGRWAKVKGPNGAENAR